jgi:uncharacterized SAM-binding protein YcdF (DUF218 family)
MNKNIKAITKLIFLSEKPFKADLIISPGTFRKGVVEKTLEIYKKGYAPKIITTGGVTRDRGITEGEYQRDFLIENGVPNEDILLEKKSLHTRDNALFAKEILDKEGIKYEKILLISKTYHARRIFMTFKQVFPKSEIRVISTVDDRNITKDNWYKDHKKKEMVMGEVRKIGEYFLKGDLGL